MAIVFENAYGHSPKIRVAFSQLYRALPPEAYSGLQRDKAAYVRDLITTAKVKKLATAACRNVAKSYPCGIRKQRLLDQVDRLYKTIPDKLSRVLDDLEK